MTDPQTLLRLLNDELDQLEGDMARHLRGATPYTGFSTESYMKSYGQLLELQAMVSSRRVEVTTAPEPQEPPVAQPLHSEGVLAVINALIRYHDSNSSLVPKVTWGMTDHRHATETLKLLRDHLDHCYEVRS